LGGPWSAAERLDIQGNVFEFRPLASEGITSRGWATFLQALADAGLSVDGTWPVRELFIIAD
jgi:PhoPQ-activated pathogenicity-related protein